MLSVNGWVQTEVFNPPQESLFFYMLQQNQGIMLPMICKRLPGTRDIRFFQIKLFLTSTCTLSITFATKFYVPSETDIPYKFQAGYHEKKDFVEEIFGLCAVNVMHVLDRFFSGQAMVLEDLSHIRYRWSYLAKQVLHLKLH